MMKLAELTRLCVLVIITFLSVTVSVEGNCDGIVMPIGCECTSINSTVKSFKCNKQMTVPKFNVTGSPITIQELNLEYNNITSLEDNDFQGNYQIQRINLNQNKIRSISENAFSGLDNLLELKLSGDKTLDIHLVLNRTKILFKLQVLHLSHFRTPQNNLEKIGLISFTELIELQLEDLDLIHIEPSVLILPKLKKLRLIKNLFESLPIEAIHNTLVNIEHLAITESKITEISHKYFERNTKVKFLDFSQNQISLLDDGCFFGITDVLEEIILNQNPLSNSTQLDQIQNLRALVSLRLEQTGLRQIPDNPVFMRNKPKLKYLYLNGNQLTSLPSGMFLTTGNLLEKIDLSHNQLNSLPSNIFDGLIRLTDLFLESQKLAGTFTLPSFTSLQNLKNLNLEYTKLNTAEIWNLIPNLKNLVTLNLDGTGLTGIKDFVFQELNSVEELSLQNNTISAVSYASFVGLKSIKYIYLGFNQIREMDECVFYNFTSGLTISLISNPLHCDCKLAWLKRNVIQGTVQFATRQEKCNSPSNNANKLFVNVDYNDFVCDVHRDPPVCPPVLPSTTSSTTPSLPPQSTEFIPDIQLSFNIDDKTYDTIIISFSATPLQYVKEYQIRHTNQKTQEAISKTIPKTATSHTMSRLDSSTTYEVCVEARKINDQYKRDCQPIETLKDPRQTTTKPLPVVKNDDTGIIIGAVVGGVILLGLLAAILYLLIFKRRSKKDITTGQDPVKVVKRSNLPTIGYDSKRFGKKKQQNGRSQAINENTANENIQVAVISNGQTEPQPNLGRISAGSYQNLDENKKVNINPEAGGYMNSNEMRPLPATPRKHHAYQNEAFQRSPTSDKEINPYYSEIKLENPV